MGNFIENVRIYLNERSIRNAYLELMTGWDKSRVSRILSGETELKYADMQMISDALGKDLTFFLQDADAMRVPDQRKESIAFFAGHLDAQDTSVAEDLIEMFRYYDSLITSV